MRINTRPGGPSAGEASESDFDRSGRLLTAWAGSILLVLNMARRPSLRSAALALLGGSMVYRGVKGHWPFSSGVPATGTRRPRTAETAPQAPDQLGVRGSITIGKPADELYRCWRDVTYLRPAMAHFAEVAETGDGRQHWRVHTSRGRTLEWDSRVVEERPAELLRWETTDGADIPNAGAVRFAPAPGERGTEMTLHLLFRPPAGTLGRGAARLFALGPKMIAEKALRRFKSLVETGEIPTLEANPAARWRNGAQA